MLLEGFIENLKLVTTAKNEYEYLDEIMDHIVGTFGRPLINSKKNIHYEIWIHSRLHSRLAVTVSQETWSSCHCLETKLLLSIPYRSILIFFRIKPIEKFGLQLQHKIWYIWMPLLFYCQIGFIFSLRIWYKRLLLTKLSNGHITWFRKTAPLKTDQETFWPKNKK